MEKWNDQIDKITADFFEHFGKLSEKELNFKPQSQTWSIAQNIAHLVEVNDSYFPVFKNLESGNNALPFIARFGFMASFFGNLIKKSVEPSRKKKIKTFPVWQPGESNFSSKILSNFKSSQEELKRYIVNFPEHIEKKTVISSPANKTIVYRLETALDIIVMHQERHLNQALEVKTQFTKESMGNGTT